MGSGHNIFVSYNHADKSVQDLGYNPQGTVDYAEEIERVLSNHTIVKNLVAERGEPTDREENLAKLEKEMAPSDVTILLLSPEMRDMDRPELEQWTPWEMLYSMNPKVRANPNVNRSAVLAVVLPDKNGSYDHVFKKGSNREIVTDGLFTIVKQNMMNISEPYTDVRGNIVIKEDSSFIPIIKWSYFHSNADHYVDVAWQHRRDEDMYDLVTELE